MRAPIFLVATLISAAMAPAAPTLNDPALIVEKVIDLPEFGTGLAFIGPDDILINLKNSGKVQRVQGGTVTGTVLDLPVNSLGERGLLDIKADPEFTTNNLVYVYYTAAAEDGASPTFNRVSRFTWNGTALINEDVLINLPVGGASNHNGGILAFGPPTAALADQKLFIIIGDLNRDGQTQNYFNDNDPDYTGQIMRLNRDGSVPLGDERGPFYDVAGFNENLETMFAYGVRNSYGMDFDPVTGNLWDTENGPSTNDEINLVAPAFNSGWETIMGKAPLSMPSLVQFGGVGTYSDPEFVWFRTIAPTAIHFLRGSGLGATYLNDCFMGASNNGNLYHFEMTSARDKFALSGDLADEVLSDLDDDDQIVVGNGFGSIIDMTTGPDGNLYVLSYNALYRVRSNGSGVDDWQLFE